MGQGFHASALAESLVGGAGLLYLVAMVVYTFYLFFKKDLIGYIGTLVGFIGFILHIVSFFMRWVEFYNLMDHQILRAIPITNLYESLLFFALVLAGIYLVVEFKSKNRTFGAFAFAISGAVVLFIGALGASPHISPLIPALQSNWLLAHVSLSFIAYVCFAIAAMAALVYLINTTENRNKPSYYVWTIIFGGSSGIIFYLIIRSIFGFTFESVSIKILFYALIAIGIIITYIYGIYFKNLFKGISLNLDIVEGLTYKFIAAGFAIFTIGGIVFGAVWAEQAWGVYWSWDPKETWAFITWVIYGIYLHGRLSGKWSKNTAASVALIGFVVTIFTFLGVNLLLSGLHSYGSM